jgi:hypothetical protein
MKRLRFLAVLREQAGSVETQSGFIGEVATIWIRFLLALNVLQTIGVFVLLSWSVHESQSCLEPRLQATSVTTASPHSMGSDSERIASSPDEERLRTIMREELRRQLQSHANEYRAPAPAVVEQPRDAAEDRRRQELVAQQVETYISVGSITQQQILDLQAQMAPLDAKTRTKVMSRLMKAVNSGDLDAQF